MSEFDPESYDVEEVADEERPDDRHGPDPEVDPEPRLDVGGIDPDAEAAEADQLDQAWEVDIDEQPDRG